MKRRDFLKGVMGAGAAIAVPSLVNASAPKQLNFKSYPAEPPLEEVDWFSGLAPLKQEGARVAYDVGREPPQSVVIYGIDANGNMQTENIKVYRSGTSVSKKFYV